jgi:thiosulfate dehydrogenase [quinone] large subunit
MTEMNSRLFAFHVAAAHGLLRLTLGVAMLMHGVVRIHGGVGKFAGTITELFRSHGSLLPSPAVHGFGLIAPPVEVLLGALLIAGLFSLPTLIATGLWMITLVFGSSTIQDWAAVQIQLVYSIVVFLLIAGQPFDQWSVDSVRRGMRGGAAG